MNIGIVSLGCPKNLLDSEILLGLAQKHHVVVSSLVDADVVLINTCSFIEEAREESIQMILELVEMKLAGTIQYIVVCGCLPQKFSKDLEREIPEIDAMIGTFTLHKITECLEKIGKTKKIQKFVVTKDKAEESYVYERYFLTAQHTKYIKIAEGCDHRCSFCIIPQLRGDFRSRPMDVIVDEARMLIAAGAKELILIAQDTSNYGVDLYKKRMLSGLLGQLNALPGAQWIRVLYLFPNHIDDELLETIRDCEHVCNYIDVPLQHVSDSILKDMRRNTSKSGMKELVARIRRIIPAVTLRTSMIVGYPGETYKEFNELLDFVGDVRFERLGAFMYSDEVDAASYKSAGKKVSDTVKKNRFQDIMLLQQDISRQINESLVGQEMDVLVDGDSATEESFYSGRSYMDAPDIDCQILIKKDDHVKPGDMVRVRIKSGLEYDLVGEIIR